MPCCCCNSEERDFCSGCWNTAVGLMVKLIEGADEVWAKTEEGCRTMVHAADLIALYDANEVVVDHCLEPADRASTLEVFEDCKDHHTFHPQKIWHCQGCMEFCPDAAQLRMVGLPAVVEPETGGHTHVIAVYFADGCYIWLWRDRSQGFEFSGDFNMPESGLAYSTTWNDLLAYSTTWNDLTELALDIHELASQHGGFRSSPA